MKNKNVLISPIGNRILIINLEENKSMIPENFQTRSDIIHLKNNESGRILIAIDNEGYSIVYDLEKNHVINYFKFKGKVNNIEYSLDYKFIAVTIGTKIFIYESPTFKLSCEPFLLIRKINTNHNSEIKMLTWSPDSRFLLTSCDEFVLKLYNVFPIDNYTPFNFTGNKKRIVKAFFSSNMDRIISISKDGLMLIWKFIEGEGNNNSYNKFKSGKDISKNDKEIPKENQDEEYLSEMEKKIMNGKFIWENKKLFHQESSYLKYVYQNYKNNFIIFGHYNGFFCIYKIKDSEIFELENMQNFSLNISKITSIDLNFENNWIAFSSKNNGNLIVWEWRSQTYIINQKGKFNEVMCASYSNDSKFIITGTLDGEIKIYDGLNYFCIKSIKAHESKVTDIKFHKKNVFVTGSFDGSIKAFELKKFKEFKSFKLPNNNAITTLEIDSSGEILVAGCFDPYECYCWNFNNGHLLEIISGFTAPLSQILFLGNTGNLAISSWEGTLRLRDLFSPRSNQESINIGSKITSMASKFDGKEIAICTIKGEILFFETENMNGIGIIDCYRDLKGGRSENDTLTIQKNIRDKFFNCLLYSLDGDTLIGGGNSSYLCFYDIKHRTLIKRLTISQNRSMDGVLRKLNSKNIVDGYKKSEIQEIDSDISDNENFIVGSKKPDFMKRNIKVMIEIRKLRFESNGKDLLVTTSEGLYIIGNKFNKNKNYIFSEDLNPENFINCLKGGNYVKFFILSIQSKRYDILVKILYKIPINSIKLIVEGMGYELAKRFLEYLVNNFEVSQNIGYDIIYIKNLLFIYLDDFRIKNSKVLSNIKLLLKNLNLKLNELNTIVSDNLSYIEIYLDQIN